MRELKLAFCSNLRPDPGYTVNESLEELGSSLVLPEWLEDRRTGIEAQLPPLAVDN